jgi:hypothetical protein
MSTNVFRCEQVATHSTLIRFNISATVCPERSTYQSLCPICGSAVPLESAKTDELGIAIHDDCYLLKLRLKQASS